jgi:phosphoribosyl-ATP pyrophosphohydrolase/phosphoribosyl-AMP cyclohydrolase
MISVTYNKEGLIPAIVQDYKDNAVLMMAYMNKESLEKTIATGETWFYSRSRQKLWHKGETSGHIQKVKEILVDCDQDTLLIKVEQVGDIACHTGKRSCFHEHLK